MDIKFLFTNQKDNQQVSFLGRVRSNRSGKKVSFIVLNDGTTFKDVQVVYKEDLQDYDKLTKIRPGSIVQVDGVMKLTPNSQQPFEIQAQNLQALDEASEDYQLQKKEHSLEFLREIAHLRARTKKFNAVFKLRSLASFAIHKFFQEDDFIYVTTPIITANDAEGAGESFGVVTFDEKNQPLVDDFFSRRASLTVSGQLNAEAFAQAFKKVYTFGPTFRAEKSFTSKHLSEF
jgi:asparaginyl-tRNA synthetase